MARDTSVVRPWLYNRFRESSANGDSASVGPEYQKEVGDLQKSARRDSGKDGSL